MGQNSVNSASIFALYIGLVLRPVHTIRFIVSSKPVTAGIITAIIMGLLTAGLSVAGFDTESLDEAFEGGAPEISFLAIVPITAAFVLFGGIAYVIGATILHLVTRLFGGNGSWSATFSGLTLFSVLGVIQLIPLALAAFSATTGWDGSSSVFGAITSVIQLITTVWTIILIVILVRENYRLTTGVAVLSTLVSGLVSIFTLGLIAIVFILMLVVILIAIYGLALMT